MNKDEAAELVNGIFAREAQKRLDETEVAARAAESSGDVLEAERLRAIGREAADFFMEVLAMSARSDRQSS